MKITHTQEDGIYTFRPEGDIIIDHATALKNYLEPFLEDTKTQGFIFDFQYVHFLDSIGIGTLVSLSKKCRIKHIHFILFGMDQVVRTIFDMTQLDKIMVIFKTREHALEYIRSATLSH